MLCLNYAFVMPQSANYVKRNASIVGLSLMRTYPKKNADTKNLPPFEVGLEKREKDGEKSLSSFFSPAFVIRDKEI